MKNLFLYIGVYTTIATLWRAYELEKYKKLKPRNGDTVIALVLAFIITCFIF